VSADGPIEPPGERRRVLEELAGLLRHFGIANDAQDHKALSEASRLRRDASARIRELMLQHPFVAVLLPSLGDELESGRIETFGWSGLVDAVEGRLQTVHVDLIPWDRVVHFRGRGTQLPEHIAQLATDAHAAAEQRLLDCLVQQGRVVQATPLAVRLILGSLRFGLVKDPGAVQGLLERIAAAVRLQTQAATQAGVEAPRADWSLFGTQRLWPPFESSERDQSLWREWHPSEAEVLGWAILTQRLFDEHARLVAV
jgi:hypothetical protein